MTDLGALMVPFDKPEAGLDMLQESMTRLGLTPGEDMFIALNLAGQEIFDYVSNAPKYLGFTILVHCKVYACMLHNDSIYICACCRK